MFTYLSTSQAAPHQVDRITQEQVARLSQACCEVVLIRAAIRLQDHGVPALSARGNPDVREAFHIMLSKLLATLNYKIDLLRLTPLLTSLLATLLRGMRRKVRSARVFGSNASIN